MLASLLASALGAVEPQTDAQLHFLLGKFLAEDGQFVGALAEIDRALASGIEDPYLRLERAAVLFQLGRADEASAEIARSRALAPDDADILKLQGRIELARAEEHPEAVRLARESLEALRKARPEDLETLLSLGQLYLGTGQPALAVELIEEAARLRPNHPWIESLRARALTAVGDADAAEQILSRSLERDPGDLAARFELADRLGQQDRHLEAVAVLEQAPAGQRERLDHRERFALELFLAGEPERARPIAQAIVDERPDVTSARLLSARIQVTLGFFEEAERSLLPLERLVEDHDSVSELLVRALEGQGRVAEAAAVLERRRTAALAANRTDDAAGIALELARLWSRSGDWQRAAEAGLAAAATDEPTVAAIGLRLGARALANDGRVDDALARVGEADPNRPERAILRIELLLAAGRVEEAGGEGSRLLSVWPRAPLAIGGAFQDHELYERALPLLEQAAEAAPDSLEASFRLATCYERMGRFDDAVTRFRHLLERAPSFSPALNYLGYLWIERAQNLEEALRLVRQAVRLEPDNGAYVDSLGWGEFQLGRYAHAVELLERAARLRPRDATVHEHLGDARAAAGDLTGAQEAYRRALDLGTETAAELERKLSSVGGGR